MEAKLNIAVGLAASIGFAFRLRGLILTTSFQTNPVSLKDLMRECHEGKLQLPDFQRGWQPWSEREKPRRDTIKLYNALYMLRQQLEGVSDVPVELVCGIGFASLFRGGQRLRYPLLTMAMELSLDERSHCIEARPRLEADPGLELDPLDRMGLHGLDQWRATSEKFLSGLDEVALSPFAAESFEPILRQAAALFDPDGLFVPDARPADARKIQSAEQNLQVSNAFAFFQRERRATQLMEDLRRFRASLSEGAEASALPAAVAALLIEPSDTIEEPDYPQFRGISTIPGVTSSDGSGKDLFFPKPFNREQVEVVQRLEVRPGVVVQGPPGTGKTHTIANIISHYLALGMRVLVTSQKAPALRVLRDKLPEAVRPLAVSLLDSDRDGLKQFQESVDIIAEKLQRLRRHELEREIADLDHQIDNLHRGLARIDNEVDAIGRMAVSPVKLGDETIEPVRAARMVVAELESANWLSDEIDAAPEFEPRFSDSEITELRQARRQVGQDIGYLGLSIPQLASLPTLDSLLPIHRDLARAEELRRQINAGTLPDLRVPESEAAERLQTLAQELDELDLSGEKASTSPYGWTADATRIVRANEDREFVEALERLQPEIEHLLAEASHFLTRPISLPADALDDEKLLEALQRLCDGKPALGFVGGLFAGKIKAALAQVTLLGEAPRGADEWLEVQRFIDGIKRSRKLAQAWNHLVSLSVGDTVESDGLGVAKRIRAQQQHLDAIRDLVIRQGRVDALARDTVAGWSGALSDNSGVLTKLRDVVDTHRLKYRLEGAEAVRAKLISYLSSTEGDVARQLQGWVVRALGNPDVTAEAFQSEWQALTGRLGHIEGLGEAFQAIDTACTAIAGSGAPLWARALRSQPIEGMEDNLTPGDWSKRWQLRQLSTWLSRIDRHDRLRELGADRVEKEVLLKDAYERSIELRTWLELSRKATDGVKAALAAYADAVRRIGKGTGKRAGRFRREARAASDRAKGALPCWIMPHYRVSESLPADLGLFDIVIVGTEVMERHEIRVGDPTAFQGDERDIMFVSLVAQRADSPLSGNRYEQRFNVALSRARDRTYLVRSVEMDQLRASDQLRRSLLEHFRCPYPAETSDLKDRRDRCESDFEREMFDLLCERGFRVNTQVRVGNFRIDLVVEGDNDQRIAIECDGDRYHGPDKWPDDMMRQRILERAGWTVWRCFASRFVRSRQQVIDELADFLAARGIQPVSGDGNWASRHTELRLWRPTIGNDDEIIAVPDEEDSSSTVAPADPLEAGEDLFEAKLPKETPLPSKRVTESHVQAAIVDLMSDNTVWSNGDLKKALRSVLPLSDGDREPAKFRPGEEKWEELVNNALSPSRGNSLHSKGLVKSAGRGLHILAEAATANSATEAPELELPAIGKSKYRNPAREIGEEYRVASLSVPDDDADQIYQTDYKHVLEQMVDHVLEIEGPIYEDMLIERIARAHKKERAGRIIQDIVAGAIAGRHPSISEDGRKVVFHRRMDVMELVAYRPARSDWRSHRDIPLIELASLALPLVRKAKPDTEILAHFARTFSLARLREPTRKRFEAAISIARATATLSQLTDIAGPDQDASGQILLTICRASQRRCLIHASAYF